MKDKWNTIIEQEFNKPYICLSDKDIKDEDFVYLCSNCTTPNVQSLYIQRNQISSIGILDFTRLRWNNLRYLSLKDNLIGNMACKYLTIASMQNLRGIMLGNNTIGSQGVHHLSKATWKNLIEMGLYSNKISNSGVKYLLKGNFKNLSQVQIYYNMLTSYEANYFLLAQSQLHQIDLMNNLQDQVEKNAFKSLMEKKIPEIYVQTIWW